MSPHMAIGNLWDDFNIKLINDFNSINDCNFKLQSIPVVNIWYFPQPLAKTDIHTHPLSFSTPP